MSAILNYPGEAVRGDTVLFWVHYLLKMKRTCPGDRNVSIQVETALWQVIYTCIVTKTAKAEIFRRMEAFEVIVADHHFMPMFMSSKSGELLDVGHYLTMVVESLGTTVADLKRILMECAMKNSKDFEGAFDFSKYGLLCVLDSLPRSSLESLRSSDRLWKFVNFYLEGLLIKDILAWSSTVSSVRDSMCITAIRMWAFKVSFDGR